MSEEEDDLKLIKRTIPKFTAQTHVPLLTEFSMTLTAVVVVLTAIFTGGAALLARAPMPILLLRMGVSILVVGLIGYGINWFIGRYLLNMTIEKFTEELAGRSAEEMDFDTETDVNLTAQV